MWGIIWRSDTSQQKIKHSGISLINTCLILNSIRRSKNQGYGMVMTSTQADEEAQHFYRKIGYKESGGFTIDIPGYEQPMELIFIKAI